MENEEEMISTHREVNMWEERDVKQVKTLIYNSN